MAPLSVVLALLLVAAVKGQEWNYTNNGDDWEGVCRTGNKQSPINIHSRWTVPKAFGKPLRFLNYDDEVSAKIEVDQHHFTIRVVPDPKVRIAVSGGGLRGTYVLKQIHFHWGSEHLIDSKRFALEAHLVHFRDIYGNNTDAAAYDPEGVAVLGTLYCAQQARANSNLQTVLQGTTSQDVRVRVRDFLPSNLDFYHYYGSLTTPPCSEAVVWTVFKNAVPVSQQQIDGMKSVFPESVKTTYRNVQPLNGRVVQRWQFSNGLKNKLNFLTSSLNQLLG